MLRFVLLAFTLAAGLIKHQDSVHFPPIVDCRE